MRIKAFLGIILVYSTTVLSADDLFDIVPMPPANENFNAFPIAEAKWNPGKKQRGWGIATTMVVTGAKIRTGVRYTYEEMKLWMGVVEKYREVQRFLDKGIRDYFNEKFDDTKRLFTTWDGSWNGIIDKLENLADVAEWAASPVSELDRRFDRRVAKLERAWDAFGSADNFTYTVGPFTMQLGWVPTALVPNTKGVLDYIDEYVMDGLLDKIEGARWEDLTSAIAPGMPPRKLDRYEEVIITNQTVIAQAMATSLEYRKWAQRALEKLEITDKQFDRLFDNTPNAGGANAWEFAAVWYSIENVNAYNMRIAHAIEEAKLLQAMIGTTMHEQTEHGAQRIIFQHDAMGLVFLF